MMYGLETGQKRPVLGPQRESKTKGQVYECCGAVWRVEAIIPRMVKSSYVFALASAPWRSNISTAGTCHIHSKICTAVSIFTFNTLQWCGLQVGHMVEPCK